MTLDEDGSRQVIVWLDGVRKDYVDTTALGGVSLAIHAGDSVAVMRSSCCGRSTLLNMVAGRRPWPWLAYSSPSSAR